MSIDVASHQAESYLVSVDVYEGPLDLLLQLIERAELDITTLSLAKVTDQYLAYLSNLEERNPAEVSAFLVIAAKLLQIKSAALLPRPAPVDTSVDEEEPGEALARQLIQYRRFKQLAGFLSSREENNLRTYLRVAPPEIKVEARLDLSGITRVELVDAARTMLLRDLGLTELSKVVNLPRVTIRQKITGILTTLRQAGTATFKGVLQTRSRLEIVVTFLAMLELIKRRIIQVEQPALFSDIELIPLGNLEENEDSVSEFGD